jgi:hypothetical protein
MQVSDNGTLSNAPGSPVTTGQGFVIGAATTQQGNFAYFGGDSAIPGFSINHNCQMTPIPGSPFASGGSSPFGITTEGNGKFVFAVNSGSLTVSSLQIGTNGSLTVAATAPVQGSGANSPTGITAYPVIVGP